MEGSAGSLAVLVVEDDTDLRLLVEFALTDAGYRVQTAADGLAALEQVARGLPCLILLDMKMPRMDGWQFARAFRARYNQTAPIVVVTAAEEAALRAAEIGAEGHLDKPFKVDDLLAVVHRHCGPPS